MQDAIDAYKRENDWLGHFLDEKCELGNGLREKSSDLYVAYRNFCTDTNEFVRSTTDFYAAIENAGFQSVKPKGRSFITGLRLKVDDGDFEDFLN